MKEKISCIIQHKKPIDVIVFTKGLAALSKMYARRADKKCDTKLLISEVRKGSICVEMIATTVATLFQAVHPIILTINDFRQIYNYLLNPSAYDKPQENIVFADYSNSVDISNISNSEGTITTFKDSQGNTIINNYYRDCNTINSNYNDLIRPNGDIGFYRKVLFYWNQTDFDKFKTGNKGTIRDIVEGRKHVVFDNNQIKQKMTESKDWHKKGYIINVYAQENSEGIVKSYKIMNVYDINDD